MATDKRLLDAIKAVGDELMALSNEEFDARINESRKEMADAILNGGEHLGLSMWYMNNPESCQKYCDELRAKHNKKRL